MSTHIYGHGICTDAIKETTIDKIKALIAMAPQVHDIWRPVYKYAEEDGIDTPDEFAEYMGQNWVFQKDDGLATILAVVIAECEGINLDSVRDSCCNTYLIMPEKLPWKYNNKEKQLVAEDLDAIIRKYVGVLTDEVLEIKYLDVEYD